MLRVKNSSMKIPLMLVKDLFEDELSLEIE